MCGTVTSNWDLAVSGALVQKEKIHTGSNLAMPRYGVWRKSLKVMDRRQRAPLLNLNLNHRRVPGEEQESRQ